MIEPIRLLAFAFAGADLLFEIDRAGTVLFATGATSGFSGSADLVGRPATDLFRQTERWRFTIITRGLTPGERAGPLPVTLASGEKATLSMCYLPPNEHISCTLVKLGNRGGLAAKGTDTETGLADRNTFLSVASQSAGGEGAIALVNVPDIADIYAKLSPEAASTLMAEIGDSVKAMDATIAGRLSKTSFGVLTEDPASAKDLAARIQTPARAHGAELKTEEVLLSLKDRDLNTEQVTLALRHVISRFADGKMQAAPGTNLAQVFEQLMTETIARAQGFCATVADGAFDLAFEPIVELKSTVVAHYEALTRFQPGQSPADTIRFAEDLGPRRFLRSGARGEILQPPGTGPVDHRLHGDQCVGAKHRESIILRDARRAAEAPEELRQTRADRDHRNGGADRPRGGGQGDPEPAQDGLSRRHRRFRRGRGNPAISRRAHRRFHQGRRLADPADRQIRARGRVFARRHRALRGAPHRHHRGMDRQRRRN